MYSITEVSRRLHVHSQTLRNWERKGLLKPERFGQARIFSDYDIRRCEEIKRYSRRGVSLERIRSLLTANARIQNSNGSGGEK